jgi:hypothetical protein
VPPAIGVAILRHRMFDIDLIINRTIVYAIITAILGGLYVAVIELTQRMFVIYTGQRSDTAIVITAFVVATAFTPVQKWAERVVERRLGGRDQAEMLDAFSSSIEAVVRVIDPLLAARRRVEECVGVFEAAGGALYLDSYGHTEPSHTHGHVGGVSAIEVASVTLSQAGPPAAGSAPRQSALFRARQDGPAEVGRRSWSGAVCRC